MARIRLTHHCFLAGCVGQPGDEIDVNEADAAHLERIGGGKRIVDRPVEIADATPGENRGSKIRSTRKTATAATE